MTRAALIALACAVFAFAYMAEASGQCLSNPMQEMCR